MKPWLAHLITGPVGVVAKPIIAAIIGALVAIIYKQAWDFVYHYQWMANFANQVISALDPSLVKSLTPTAVGVASATAAWGFGADWIISHLMGGNKAIQ